MYKEDIEGSIAHATMLGRCGIIKQEEADDIVQGLKGILADIENGTLHIDMEAEDIHTFIEGELTKRIGDNGKRLHTSRSRNDQVAVDIKLYLKKEVVNVKKLVVDLIKVIADKAEKYSETVMPGYTHLQRAQPITFGHHLLAYGCCLSSSVCSSVILPFVGSPCALADDVAGAGLGLHIDLADVFADDALLSE